MISCAAWLGRETSTCTRGLGCICEKDKQMIWHNSGKELEIEHDSVTSRRYKEDLDDVLQQIKSLEDELTNLKDFTQDLQDTYDKERARVDWLEQLTDTDTVCDIVVNWKSRNRRWPSGMRDAIDAAMQSAVPPPPTIS